MEPQIDTLQIYLDLTSFCILHLMRMHFSMFSCNLKAGRHVIAFAFWTSIPISSNYYLYAQHSAIHGLHVWLSKMTKLDRTRFSCLLSDRCCNGPCCGWCSCTILSNGESPVVMRRSGCTTD